MNISRWNKSSATLSDWLECEVNFNTPQPLQRVVLPNDGNDVAFNVLDKQLFEQSRRNQTNTRFRSDHAHYTNFNLMFMGTYILVMNMFD
jgi:hypothetical protein